MDLSAAPIVMHPEIFVPILIAIVTNVVATCISREWRETGGPILALILCTLAIVLR